MKIYNLLRSLLTTRDKQFLSLLLFLSIIISVIETLSISAIMVFISIATNPELINKNPHYFRLYTLFNVSSPTHFMIIMGGLLIGFYLIRGALNVVHIYAMARFAYTRYHYFASLLFNRFLRFSYATFVNKNSASLSQAIFLHCGALAHFMFALLSFFSEAFVVLCIYAMLFVVNWKMTLVLTIFLSGMGFLIIKLFSRSIARAGRDTHNSSLESTKIFNESFGNFKLIKLNNAEPATVDRFSFATNQQSLAQIMYTTLQNSPRFILETVGFVLLLSIMVYVLYWYHDADFLIPLLSMYALAFYRLLPSMNKILSCAHQITYHRHSLQSIYDFLHNPVEQTCTQSLKFSAKISLHNVTFGYALDKPILQNVTLTIERGQRVAFVGASGSGKSTLVDLIMGLYQDYQGQVCIDDTELCTTNCRAWREKIGYIPQSIYLFDGTVGDNVVFGRVPDTNAIVAALLKAHVYDFLLTQQGLETRVGEGGVKLSGGQKQRIAIARALYANPELLVLDEATSALDQDIEASIMNEIYQISRDVTLIIIAHRPSTIARCDTVYKIENGFVERVSPDVQIAEGVAMHHL